LPACDIYRIERVSFGKLTDGGNGQPGSPIKVVNGMKATTPIPSGNDLVGMRLPKSFQLPKSQTHRRTIMSPGKFGGLLKCERRTSNVQRRTSNGRKI
jgi:hypothetical protein